ncbi:hypothetical protein BJ993_002816 [Nocardioides aromaticivorans]|uniref:Uncharacterized protein n=1 Tax=Nocardioides aromaticivorans TaxID=200618 RepID=A0A7Z0CLG4_9ACTN|nr:hypothetical protein [Nocardioides aromaticivorans]NYI45736.1 hypothetical protein [Nocardioides aromaticivorans]QSR24829.1 hypothetical protein CFH99_04255 [Nocardioides aromaticivorans]
MDLSALIFVALAVAWAVYLVPKALKYHEEDSANRSVDGFSDRLRVLARREAVSASAAELVPAGRKPSTARVEESVEEPAAPAEPEVAHDEEPAAPTPAPRAPRPALARRLAARRAAERRRRVFNVLLLLNLVVAGLGIGKVIGLAWIAAPVALLVAWLVACRLMVRRERAARAAANRRRRRTLADEAIAAEDAETDEVADEPAEVLGELDADDNTDEIPAVTAALLEEEPVVDGWTPVPVPLPTYVAKAPAGRTVRTIDLDSTGVWSSGRNEADSQLAREADAQRAQADADAAADERRASGS